MRNLAHPQVQLEDTLQAFLEFESGACGTVQASTALWPGSDIRIEINGEDGTAIMQGERITTWQFREELPEDEEVRKIGSGQIVTTADGTGDFAFVEHQYMTENFVRAVKYGEPLRIPCESARGSLELALAMYRSADGGREVSLPL